MAQRPDTATAKDTAGNFKPHSEGQCAVLCVDVVNLGTKVEEYPGQPVREVDKAVLVFASGERQEEDDSLVLVTAEMTLSMNEKANMRRFLESWRGKSYTAEQADEGVPLEQLQGQAALVSIEHVITKRNRKFAKIKSVSPLPKAMDALSNEILEEYTRPPFFEDRKKEYADGVRKYRAEVGVAPDDVPDDECGNGDEEEDDLPF